MYIKDMISALDFVSAVKSKKDDNREYCNTIHIRTDGEHIRVLKVNGHIMSWAFINEECGQERDKNDYFLSEDTAKNLLTTLKTLSRSRKYVELEFSESSLMVADYQFPLKLLADMGMVPDIDRIITDTTSDKNVDPEPERFALNPVTLQQVATGFAKIKAESFMVESKKGCLYCHVTDSANTYRTVVMKCVK